MEQDWLSIHHLSLSDLSKSRFYNSFKTFSSRIRNENSEKILFSGDENR